MPLCGVSLHQDAAVFLLNFVADLIVRSRQFLQIVLFAPPNDVPTFYRIVTVPIVSLLIPWGLVRLAIRAARNVKTEEVSPIEA